MFFLTELRPTAHSAANEKRSLHVSSLTEALCREGRVRTLSFLAHVVHRLHITGDCIYIII